MRFRHEKLVGLLACSRKREHGTHWSKQVHFRASGLGKRPKANVNMVPFRPSRYTLARFGHFVSIVQFDDQGRIIESDRANTVFELRLVPHVTAGQHKNCCLSSTKFFRKSWRHLYCND